MKKSSGIRNPSGVWSEVAVPDGSIWRSVRAGRLLEHKGDEAQAEEGHAKHDEKQRVKAEKMYYVGSQKRADPPMV